MKSSIHQANPIGVHYYPDTLHYSQADLRRWLPQLQSMGIRWVTLRAPAERAIPEDFLLGLLEAGIEPVLHFNFTPAAAPSALALEPMLSAYGGWGVRYAAIFDRPNQRSAWKPEHWGQIDLVEQFTDIYLPYLKALLAANLIPVLPPLEPGGDYWDTAFLRKLLRILERRRTLPANLVLGAYGFTQGKPVDWGAGGPERWIEARPYLTPPGEQDQLGFHLYEWYQAISQAVFGCALPVIYLSAGVSAEPTEQASAVLEDLVYRLRTGQYKQEHRRDTGLLACNFWLLADAPGEGTDAAAWFVDGKQPARIVEKLKAWQLEQPVGCQNGRSSQANEPVGIKLAPSSVSSSQISHRSIQAGIP